MAAGRLTGAIMNSEKCFPPAQKMVILGFLYDAIAKLCKLSEEKKDKYITRIENILKSEYIKNKLLEKIVGNLTYAAWVSPFGRPFLSVLSSKITSSNESSIFVSNEMKIALII